MKKNLFIICFLFLIFPLFAVNEEIYVSDVVVYLDNENPAVEQRQVLTAEEIKEKNVAGLPELLQAEGVQILSYGPYGLEQKPSIRGFTDETVRVIIDGICVNNAQYGTFDFSSLCIEDIEKIEIVRGGFTEGVCDEGAVAGAIYITTKKQQLGTHFYSNSYLKTYFNALCFADTFGQSLGLSTQIENTFLKFNLHGTFANNRFLFTNYNEKLCERENAEVVDGNSNLNLLHYFRDGSSLSVTDIFYGGKKNTPGAENSDNSGVQKDFDNNLSFQLINPEVGGILKLENNLAWLCNIRFYDDNLGHSEHYVNSFKYNLYENFDFGEKFKQDFGFGLDYTHLDSTDDGVHDQWSGVVKSTSKVFFNHFSASLPLAVKFCGENFAFTPKFGFGFDYDFVTFFADVYRMTQFPNMDDLYWDDGIYKGNPDLMPESGWGGEISIGSKNKFLPFNLCVFSNFYENKIQWAGMMPQNVASAFYLGGDLRVEKSFWNERINLSNTSEYLYTKLLSKENELTYGKKIMWTPDFVSSFAIGLRLPEFEGGKSKKSEVENVDASGEKKSVRQVFYEPSFLLEANYVGKRYISNLNISYMEPFVLLNFVAQLDCEVKGKSRIWNFAPYLRADNLLNWDYEAVPDYPMPGLSCSVGVKVKG